MLSTTTANSAISSVVSDVGQSQGTTILLIVGILAGLLALGWGLRKFRHYISGRKF